MARVKQVKLKVDASSLGSLDLQGIVNHIAPKVEAAFREDIGPHWVDVAKARAPVSEDRDFNPRVNSKAFKKVSLRPARDLKRASGAKRARRAELEAILAEARGSSRVDVLGSSDIEFFRLDEGPDKGATPDIIDVRRGGLVGAVKHKPGTLRDSIHVDGVTREGNQVKLRIVASAPYALPVHEGFTHRGGPKHSGKATRIKGQKFLISPQANLRERLKNPATYNR